MRQWENARWVMSQQKRSTVCQLWMLPSSCVCELKAHVSLYIMVHCVACSKVHRFRCVFPVWRSHGVCYSVCVCVIFFLTIKLRQSMPCYQQDVDCKKLCHRKSKVAAVRLICGTQVTVLKDNTFNGHYTTKHEDEDRNISKRYFFPHKTCQEKFFLQWRLYWRGLLDYFAPICREKVTSGLH